LIGSAQFRCSGSEATMETTNDAFVLFTQPG
jgi:hypothetical protein